MGVFHSPQYFSKVVIILSGHRGIDFVFPVWHLCQVIGQRLSEYVFIHMHSANPLNTISVLKNTSCILCFRLQ